LNIIALIPRDQHTGYADIIAECAAREPQLVASLTPTLQSRGLDDLLEITSNAQAQTNGVRSKTKCPSYR